MSHSEEHSVEKETSELKIPAVASKKSSHVHSLEKEAILSKKECIRKLRQLLLVLKEDYKERSEWLLTSPITVEKAPKFKRSPTPKKAEAFARTDQDFEKKIKTCEDKIISVVMSKSDTKAIDLIRKAADEEYANVREEFEQIRSRKHEGKEYRRMSPEDKQIIDDDIDLCIDKEKAKIQKVMDSKINTIISRSKSVKKRQKTKRFKIKVYQFDEVDELKKVNRKKYKDFVAQLLLDAKEDTDNFEESLRRQIDVDNVLLTDVVCRKRKDNEESIKKHNALKTELFIQELNMNLKVVLGQNLLEFYAGNKEALIGIEDLHDVWNRMANRINLNVFKSIMSIDQALLRINVEFDILHENISDGTLRNCKEFRLTHRALSAWDTFVGLVGDFWASVANESMRKRFDDRMLLYSAIYYSIRGDYVPEQKESKRALLDEKLTMKIEDLKCRRDNLLNKICMLDQEIKTRVIGRQRKQVPNKIEKSIAARKKREEKARLKLCEDRALILNDPAALKQLQEAKDIPKSRKKHVNLVGTRKQREIDFTNSLWISTTNSFI